MWPRSPNLHKFYAGAFDYLNKNSLIRFYYPIDDPSSIQGSTPTKSKWHPIDYLANYAPKTTKFLHAKFQNLKADSYENHQISEKQENYKLIIFSHGILGNRFIYSNICTFLAKCGFIVAAVEHRDRSAMHSFDINENGEKVEIFNRKVATPTGPTRQSSPETHDIRSSQLTTRVREFLDAWDTCKKLNGEIDSLVELPENTVSLPDFKNKLDTNDENTENFFKSKIENPNNPIIIGHSFGASTILKILEATPTKTFPKAIALDPWLFPLNADFFKNFSQNPHNTPKHFTVLQSQLWCWPAQIAGSNFGKFEDKCWSFVETRHQSFSDVPFVINELGFFPVWLQKFAHLRGKNCPVDSGRRMNEVILQVLESGGDSLENYEEDILYKGFMDKSCFSQNPTKVKRKIEEMYGQD